MYKVLKEQVDEVQPHNKQMALEYREEERGLEGNKKKMDHVAFKKQVKEEIAIMA